MLDILVGLPPFIHGAHGAAMSTGDIEAVCVIAALFIAATASRCIARLAPARAATAAAVMAAIAAVATHAEGVIAGKRWQARDISRSCGVKQKSRRRTECSVLRLLLFH